MADDKAKLDEGLQKVLFESLGQQAAFITHHMDRWFESIETRLSPPKSAIADGLPAAASPPSALPINQPAPPIVEAVPARPAPKALPSILSLTMLKPPSADTVRPPLATRPVVAFDLKATWTGWQFHQSVKMLAGGVIELGQARSTPGIISDPIILPDTGLVRISVDCEIPVDKAAPKPKARAVDENGAYLGPEFDLISGLTRVFFFATHRAKVIRIFVIAAEPKAGYRFTVNRVEVEAIDPESYFAHNRPLALAPAIASMASIPARRLMLQDCVNSLLLQCDRVRVFLNDYPDVPAFLSHPRVDVRRSQDLDDKGDAGKFGWIEAPDEPGYRVIVDDDIVFPPDFLKEMADKVNASGNRAIYGMHGVLLKQPVSAYYDPESRSVFYFQNALRQDRTCHVLGTNAMCYYSEAVKMTWAEFMFRNMADIFMADYAQKYGLPMVTPSRAQYWVRQNSQDGGFETIYDNSLKKTKSTFDSSAVQDALVKWGAPLTLQPTARRKIAFLLMATEAKAFEAAFKSWERARWLDYDWVVVLVSGSDNAELRAQVKAVKTPHELHIVDAEGTTGAERIARAFALLDRIGYDLLCIGADHVRFDKGGWTKTVLAQPGSRQTTLLVLQPLGHEGKVELKGAASGDVLPVLTIVGRTLAAAGGLPNAQAASAVLALGGWIARVSDAGGGTTLPEARDAAVITGAVQAAQPLPEGLRIDASLKAAAPLPVSAWRLAAPALTINDFFKKVFVINLDRRPDRWARASGRLSAAGIVAERCPAVDGQEAQVAAEYAAYEAGALRNFQPGFRQIESSRQFYQDYDSEAARIAFIEQKDRKKAIQSVGAWAYLRSWEGILERILHERIPTALVCDDDITFHRRGGPIFAAAVGGLPDDWLLLQLGTLQYHWTPDWMNWTTPYLYKTNGSAIGSHAVGLRFEAAPFLLEHVRRMLMPFDTGALAMMIGAFNDRCFVTYPNVAIQALQEISDINTSEFQKTLADKAKIAEIYRWDLTQYME